MFSQPANYFSKINLKTRGRRFRNKKKILSSSNLELFLSVFPRLFFVSAPVIGSPLFDDDARRSRTNVRDKRRGLLRKINFNNKKKRRDKLLAASQSRPTRTYRTRLSFNHSSDFFPTVRTRTPVMSKQKVCILGSGNWYVRIERALFRGNGFSFCFLPTTSCKGEKNYRRFFFFFWRRFVKIKKFLGF